MLNERIQPDVDLITQLRGDIIFGPFSTPYMKAIIQAFGKKAFGRSSACSGFEDFVRRVLAGRRGKCCLEIGTFYGVTAVLLSQFFERVVCVSIDLEPDKMMKFKIADRLGIKNIEFHDVRSNADKTAVVNGTMFDFCYMDGDHTNDTASDWALAERCGRVLFHEYWPLQPSVWNLVNSLPQDEVIKTNYDCLAYWERKAS